MSANLMKLGTTKMGMLIHNQSGSRLHRIWCGMNTRCFNPKRKDFRHYGGRGITVCFEWQHHFEPFFQWAKENGYSDELTLDRIDNNKGYSPDNCRWVSRKEQSRNQRNTRFLTYLGETKPIVDWGIIYGIPGRTIRFRIDHGWDVHDALTTPLKQGRRTDICKHKQVQ